MTVIPTPAHTRTRTRSDHELLVDTTRFGRLSVAAETAFVLPDGIPGFKDLTGIIVLPVDEDAFFVWLQAINDGELAFLAVNPWPFFPDYDVEIPDEHLAALGIETPDDAMVFCLTRADRAGKLFTVNLLAPLVLGIRSRLGRQITLDADLPLTAQLSVPAAEGTPRLRVAVAADGVEVIEGIEP